MDYKAIATAVKLCGSVKGMEECKKCHYWKGPDMSKCIPRMTEDAAAAIINLLARAEKAERERDAAIERLRVDHWCDDCKHGLVSQACRNDGECSECDGQCYCGGCEKGSLWEWKGEEE